MFTVFQLMKFYLHTELLDTKLLVCMLPKTLRPPIKDLVPVNFSICKLLSKLQERTIFYGALLAT